MVFGLAQGFPPDAIELALPGPEEARALVLERRPQTADLLARRRQQLVASFGAPAEAALPQCEDALLLGLARFGVRHGRWGNDFHHYHNEEHAIEILDGRLQRLMDGIGLAALPLQDWLALSLFAVCHDLRQRETVDYAHPVGNNEAASLAEAQRILDACGYSRVGDRGLYCAMELMIAGSTFDARPAPFNPAEAVASGGALAPKLGPELDKAAPGWRQDALLADAFALAQIASDLDTANVAEPVRHLGKSAMRLCREREMLAGRSLDARESAEPCLRFLSTGQERYFFELHRFCSAPGERTFAAAKAENAPRVRQLSAALRERCGAHAEHAASGSEVLDVFAGLISA